MARARTDETANDRLGQSPTEQAIVSPVVDFVLLFGLVLCVAVALVVFL